MHGHPNPTREIAVQSGFCMVGVDPTKKEKGICENDSDCVTYGYSQKICWKSKCSTTCDASDVKNVCDKNQYCHIDHGICHSFCKSTNECSGGYTCYNSQCYKDCYDTDDCGRNQFCHE